jgi:hypothetical protein
MKTTLIGAAIVAAVTFTQAANAQNTASASFLASANIVSPIAIVNNGPMSFGDVVPGTSAGSVVLAAAGGRTPSGVTLGGSTSWSAATFTVTGAPNYAYSIGLPGSVTINSGGNSMTVASFTSNPTGPGNLGSGGTQALAVGATLSVGASQAVGFYTGSFNVTVTYN